MRTIIALAIVLGLSACAKKQKAAATTTPPPGAGSAAPMESGAGGGAPPAPDTQASDPCDGSEAAPKKK